MIGLFQADPRGQCIDVDDAWRQISGLSRDASLANGWMSKIYRPDAGNVRERWASAVFENAPVSLVFRFARAEGSQIWVRLDARPVYGPDGSVQSYAGTLTDIDELMRLSQELEQNREQFRVLAEAMPQLVWSAGADGTIDYFNERWIVYTGLTAGSMREGGPKGVVHPDELQLTWERWSHALEFGEPYEIEYRLRNCADGNYRWFIARAVPIRDDAGKVVRWIGTATDIDAQKRLSDSLKFVLEAGNAFASSLNLETIAKRYAELAVPQFADWCFVVLGDGTTPFTNVAMRHRDPGLVRYVEQFRDRYPVQSDGVLAQSITARKAMLIPALSDEQIENSARDAQHLEILRKLAMRSVMIVPLCHDEHTYGGVVLVSSDSGRSFNERDLEVAELVAARAALAMYDANIFSQERRSLERLSFLAEASDLLFESLDLQKTFARLAELIVPHVADAAIIALIEKDDALRVTAAVHSDRAKDAVIAQILGQRILQRDSERRLVTELRGHRARIHKQNEDTIRASIRPYLADDVVTLGATSSVFIPLYSRGETFGGLLAYYCDSGRSYRENDLPLFVELGRRASIAIENAHAYERERRIAATLQEASLPSALPKLKKLRLDAIYEPAQNEAQVGGDWYDAFLLDDESLVITVGDVAGRGVQAATIMAKMRHALGVVPLYETDPARMLDAANVILERRFSDAMVTAFVAVVSPDRKTVRYANAGHPYPLLRTTDGLHELVAGGLPLGLRRGQLSSSHTMSLDGAQVLVFYTDGLTESTHDIEQGERRLNEVLRSEAVLHCANPALLIQQACLQGVSQDDVAILTLCFGAPLRWYFQSENAKAAQDARSEFVAALSERLHDPAMLACAELVFGELVGNVVRHAPGPIEIEVDYAGNAPVLHMIDTGPPFADAGDLPQDELSESGRGLFIVRRLSHRMTVEYIAGYGNHITVELPG